MDTTVEKKIIPMKGIRKIIAERMRKSLDTAVQANHRMKVDMSEAIKFKDCLKEKGVKVSITAILVKAVSNSLKEHPIMNATLTEEGIVLQNDINIGVAVAIENGLVVPCIKQTQNMSIGEIGERVRELAVMAKDKKLKPDDMYGGSFTVSNLGMYGIDSFTAIINPPESAILAVGAIQKTPVAGEDDNIIVRPMMELSLTYDHRVIDGGPAAAFLQTLKKNLQEHSSLI